MAHGIYLCYLFCWIVSNFNFSEGTDRPNIIFMLADDLGWGDVGYHGSKQIPTPNLDALAYDGVILSNYYVQPICSPTRSALLTGRHPIHTGMQHGTIESSEKYGLGLNETLMPQYLNKLGYKSHMIGKWHLGFLAKEYTPTYRGFHSHYGFLHGKADYWTHTHDVAMDDRATQWGLDNWRNLDVVKTDFGQYSTELQAREAERLIEEHDPQQPFFLYLPFQAVHNANPYQTVQAPAYYLNHLTHIKDMHRRTYAGMLMCMDSAVGNITRALHKTGMLNNTILVFSSDNGGPAHGFSGNYASNMPLRGMKQGLWEGGVSGTGLVWSPLLEKSGYTSNVLIQVTDWLPTLLHAAGYDVSSLPKNIDGIDQWEALKNGEQKGNRKQMLLNIEDYQGAWALRDREMKLIFAAQSFTRDYDDWYEPEGIDRDSQILNEAPSGKFSSEIPDILKSMGRFGPKNEPFIKQCGVKPPDAKTNCAVNVKPCLYNITADPCEYHNLAEVKPETVMNMYKQMLAYNSTSIKPRNEPVDPAGFPVYHGGIWVPWVVLNDTEKDV